MAPKQDHFQLVEGGWLIPLLMILVGTVVLLVNVNLLDREWIAYWPVLLIVIGLVKLLYEK